MQGYDIDLFIVALAKTPDDPSADGCQDRRDTRRESPDGTVRGRQWRAMVFARRL